MSDVVNVDEGGVVPFYCRDSVLYGCNRAELESSRDIVAAINSQGDSFAEALESLSMTISALPDSSGEITALQVLTGVFVAFVGALSAYLFNYFHWVMVSKKQRVSRAGKALSELIEELETLSVEYWLGEYSSERKNAIHAIEISIKSKLRLIQRHIILVVPELKSRKAASRKHKLEEFGYEIYDIVTGDEFESKGRRSSKKKAVSISMKCADMRAAISALEYCV